MKKFLVLILLILIFDSVNAQLVPDWNLQFGDVNDDWDHGLAVDSRNKVYVAGRTDGNLFAQNAGSFDVFLAGFKSSGAPVWNLQFGDTEYDGGIAVAVDSLNNVYVAGITMSELFAEPEGDYDVFLAKFDSSGVPDWNLQFGGSGIDIIDRTIAVDSQDNVYVAGYTRSDYLFEETEGGFDVFLAKFDSSGVPDWNLQFGSPNQEVVRAFVIDSLDNIYLAGWTGGPLFSENKGGDDAFLVKFDSSGVMDWNLQFGDANDDFGHGLAVDSLNNVYIGGHTKSALFGSRMGEFDVFLAKFKQLPPEPGLNSCAVLGGVVCDENIECSLGYFNPALDSERCCLGECLNKPDLIVSSVSVADALLVKGEVVPVKVVVANVGFVDANAFKVSLAVEEPFTLISEKEVEGLIVDGNIVLFFDFDSNAFDGLLKLRVETDSLSEVLEMNEENNIGVFEVFVKELEVEEEKVKEFIDLLVLNLVLDRASVIIGESVIVTVTVLNAGELASGDFVLGLFVDSVYTPVIEEKLIESLPASESREIEFVLDTLTLPEEVEIILFSDSLREIIESDEGNNITSITLPLQGAPMNVSFSNIITVGEQQVFLVTDMNGNTVPGAIVEIVLPFKEKMRQKTIFTDFSGVAGYLVRKEGGFAFTVSKKGYYSVYGEFEAVSVFEPEEKPVEIDLVQGLIDFVIHISEFFTSFFK